MTSEPVAILGYGRFGRALGELFEEVGIRVTAFDARADVPESLRAGSIAELAGAARTVVVAVPVSLFRESLAALRPHLSESHLVIDVGSVKSGPEAAMRQTLGSTVPWVATHPLFGPASLARGERPLRVVICPNELHPEAVRSITRLYHRIGCEVIEQDPSEHDRVMADTHALAFFIAKALIDIGAGEEVPFSPPSFQAIARTIEAVRSDAGHLFLAIQHENPHAATARRRLVDALLNIDEQLKEAVSQESETNPVFAIPGLGPQAPDLLETRELIDELDEEIIELLGRRAQLSKRAGRAKAEQGKGVRDSERERRLLEDRGAWAKARELEPSDVKDVFEAILRLSRHVQRK